MFDTLLIPVYYLSRAQITLLKFKIEIWYIGNWFLQAILFSYQLICSAFLPQLIN